MPLDNETRIALLEQGQEQIQTNFKNCMDSLDSRSNERHLDVTKKLDLIFDKIDKAKEDQKKQEKEIAKERNICQTSMRKEIWKTISLCIGIPGTLTALIMFFKSFK